MKCHIELITTFNKVLHPRKLTVCLSPFCLFLVCIRFSTYCNALLHLSCRTNLVAVDRCAAVLLCELGHIDVAHHCN